MTETRMITPWMPVRILGLTPSTSRPLSSTVIMSTPTMVLVTPPLPPARLVPPTTTAAWAGNILPAPMAIWPWPRRMAPMTPATPKRKPAKVNTPTFTFSTLTPTDRGMLSLVPTA